MPTELADTAGLSLIDALLVLLRTSAAAFIGWCLVLCFAHRIKFGRWPHIL